MTAAEILAALRRHHRDAALVSEVTITDEWAYQRFDDAGAAATEYPISRRRIDALMFQGRVRTAIEIKVTVADAKRENYRKVHPWRNVCHRFVYAVPAGLIHHPPVHGCGLWWVHPDGRVEARRKTTMNNTPEPLPQQVVQILAYRAAGVPLIRSE